MKALIDADIFQFEFGTATDDEFKPLPWPLVQSRMQGRLNGIMEATGADEYQLYLTTDDKSNFRYDVATIKPYKGNRKTEKPYWYTHIRNFLVDHRKAIEIHGMEADDALSIAQWEDYNECLNFRMKEAEDNGENTLDVFYDFKRFSQTVICSRDKDLDMVPGWHYCWGCGKQKEKKIWWQDEIEGLKCFYNQLLTGDTVDNIPGLFGVGKSSQLLVRVGLCSTELCMYQVVLEEYEKRFGSYAEQFLTENARLLWMLREEGEVWLRPKKKE